MSTVKTNNVQIGQSLTASQNFTWYQPATPDGTVRLGNGNAGSVTDLVTLTSAGNLGIGTSSPGVKLQVDSGATGIYALFNSTNANGGYFSGNSSGTTVWDIGTAKQALNVGGSLDFGLNVRNGFMAFGTGNTERMRLDSSGNLGLGVTPSGWRTDVSFKAIQTPGGSFTSYIAGGLDQTPGIAANAYVDSGGTWRYINSRAASWGIQNGGAHYWYNAPSGTAGNAISFTQAMTLDASGNLLVGTTSSVGAARFCVSADTTTQNPMTIANTRATAATDYSLLFYRAGNIVGSIQTSLSATSYITSSDQRLKENIADAPEALSSINDIKVRSFDWKSDGSHVDYGYIAQELLEIVPEAVSVPANPEEMMGVDFGKLTPRLVKAIQELSAELNLLKQKVNA